MYLFWLKKNFLWKRMEQFILIVDIKGHFESKELDVPQRKGYVELFFPSKPIFWQNVIIYLRSELAILQDTVFSLVSFKVESKSKLRIYYFGRSLKTSRFDGEKWNILCFWPVLLQCMKKNFLTITLSHGLISRVSK